MKIHLITNLFYPDELAGASLYTDLARFLKERGHDVRVTGTFSYYPAWKLRPEDEGVSMREEEFEGIPLRRLKMYVPAKASGFKRLLSDASFLWALATKAKFPSWQPDVVISACPMLSQCVAQRFLYVGKKVPRLLIVQDFVVDAALELGMLNLPGLSWGLRKMESWSLRSASSLSTISPEMLTKLGEKVSPNDRRLTFIPNWIHQSLSGEIDRQWARRPKRETYQLLYSGNVGVKQGLPDFVDSFEEMECGWQLRIQGGGAERARLEERTRDCQDIVMADVSGEDAYVASLLKASACLITQKPDVSANFLPSKLLPALATGTPVLAICEADTPLGREVSEGGYGAVIHPRKVDQIKATLQVWKNSPESMVALSQKARERSEFFGRERILTTYESELSALSTGQALASEVSDFSTTVPSQSS
ncbi:glycosyltransferase [Verrucomicrobiales bacterium]|jgi:colanic acid biosynthesis glycosyl transferase WcaI|nr:glycosyltransferase [Verrucomicrobiales bacterium]MDB4772500.1 glycosyltransferase [Verrucomicrobiales bacterium]MDC0503518.1 glycosyltransferase [Verrucomicrobiales bacterium]MDF1789186.1 glycosyltransferase [Verrucomicrobiales bacterium]